MKCCVITFVYGKDARYAYFKSINNETTQDQVIDKLLSIMELKREDVSDIDFDWIDGIPYGVVPYNWQGI